MAYRRRSSDQSSWFLMSHVEDPPPPANADETMDELRAGNHSFLDRIRRFGGGVPRRRRLLGREVQRRRRMAPQPRSAWEAESRRSSLRVVAPSPVGASSLIGSRDAFTSLPGNLRISGRSRRAGTRQRTITPSLFRSFPGEATDLPERGDNSCLRSASLLVHVRVRQIARPVTSPPVSHMRR